MNVGPSKAVGNDPRRGLHWWGRGKVTILELLFSLIADHVWSTKFDPEMAADLEMGRLREQRAEMIGRVARDEGVRDGQPCV